MKSITVSELASRYHQRLAGHLGEYETSDTLALSAALLREISSRSGPQKRVFLRDRLAAMVGPLVPVEDAVEFVDSVIDACLGTGDLVKVRDGTSTRLALSSPSWVRRASGSAFIVGDFPEIAASAIAGQSARGAFRVIQGHPSDEQLARTGRSELPAKVWLISPRPMAADQLLNTLDAAMDQENRAGEVTMDTILDATKPARYFRGRLVVPRRESGRYLGRRNVKWGAAAWSYCQLDGGRVSTFVDLPRCDVRFSGRDEWYWAMAAIEKTRGESPSVRVRAGSTETAVSFRSPIPSWAERRLLAVGAPRTPAGAGALLTFVVPNTEVSEELSFLRSSLWLDVVEAWS